MRVRELEMMLAKTLNYPAGQIDQRMRPLREGGILPMGGHGLHAPNIEPIHAALMLLQLVSLRASDAGPIGHAAMNLELVPVPGAPNAFFDVDDSQRVTLGAALALLIMHPDLEWQQVEVACDGGRAWLTITWREELIKLVFAKDPASVSSVVGGKIERYRNQGAADIGHRFVMGAGQVKQIGLKVRGSASVDAPSTLDAVERKFRLVLEEAAQKTSARRLERVN